VLMQRMVGFCCWSVTLAPVLCAGFSRA